MIPQKIKGNIAFNNVEFEYDGHLALKDISFEVKAGSTIGIMGATGSGKTSLINLIGRYYDCTKGSIMIDGIDVKEMDLKTLRSNISVVMQDTFLFLIA